MFVGERMSAPDAARDKAERGAPRRWGGSLDEGDEPDPRFSFANERTFLAWNRTALGCAVSVVTAVVAVVTIVYTLA
jgi:uncharacterized membrane protein YidH (DUF202 family)